MWGEVASCFLTGSDGLASGAIDGPGRTRYAPAQSTMSRLDISPSEPGQIPADPSVRNHGLPKICCASC